jgi:hypothetical protein
MSQPVILSYRVRKICQRGVRITPGYADFSDAQRAARLHCDLNAKMNRHAFAHVIPSVSKPQINL